jgi:hypothetical protein
MLNEPKEKLHRRWGSVVLVKRTGLAVGPIANPSHVTNFFDWETCLP